MTRAPRAPRGAASPRPLTWTRLSARALADQRGACLLVVVIVAVLACLLALWPRLESTAQADQVRFRLADSSEVGRDVQGTVAAQLVMAGLTGGDLPDTPEADAAVWQGLTDALTQLSEESPTPLRGALSAPDHVATTKEFSLPVDPDADVRSPAVVLAGDPRIDERVTLVQGRWPAPPTWDAATPPVPGGTPLEELPDLPVEILVADATAQRLGLVLGEPLRVGNLYTDLSLVLVGTYEVDDPEATYWRYLPAAREPNVVEDFDAGTSVLGVAYTATDGFFTTLTATQEPATTTLWFEVEPAALDGVPPALLGAQLRALTAADQPLALGDAPPFASTRLGSDLPDRLDAVASENAAVATIVLLVAVGPLGVALTVLALLARLLLTRRRSALAMITARGASAWQLRRALALEGLVLGLTAAAIGWAIGWVAVAATGPASPAASGDVAGLLAGGLRGWVPSLAVGLVPALVMATAPLPTGLRSTRRDLRAGGLVRDVVVLALAALTLAQVLGSPTGAVAGTGDLLLVGAPLVLALAVAVVVVRLYPWLARAAHEVLRRGRSLPHFLGSARAVRESGASLASVLAVVVGVSVAVFSLTTLATLRTGLERTVWVTAGADLRVSGPTVDADQLAQIRDVDGVAAAAAVATVTPAILQLPTESLRTQLYLTDTAAYADVLAQVPATVGAAPVGTLGGDDDAADGGAPVPVLTSPRLGGQGAPGARLVTSQNVEVDVRPSGDVLPGIADSSAAWVLADAAALPELAESSPPRLLLVRLAPGADAGAVTTAITDVIGAAGVTDAGGARADVADTPVFQLLSVALSVSVALAALLGIGALTLVQATAAPARARMLHRLRLLGLGRRGERALAWWELLPWVSLGVLSGLGLGLALSRLLLRPLDLRAFTQGAGQPPLVLEVVGLGAVAAAAIGVAVALSFVTSVRRTGAPPSEED